MDVNEIGADAQVGLPPRAVVWTRDTQVYRVVTCFVFFAAVIIAALVASYAQSHSILVQEGRSGPLVPAPPWVVELLTNLPQIAGTVVFAAALFYEAGYRREYRLLRYGRAAFATVANVRSVATYRRETSRGYIETEVVNDLSSPIDGTQVGGTHDDVDYLFVVDGGRYHGNFYVARATHGATSVGDRITVLYAPDNPQKNVAYSVITAAEIVGIQDYATPRSR